MSMTDDLLGDERVGALLEALEAASGGRRFEATRETAAGLAELTLSGRARALAGGIARDVSGGHAQLAGIVRTALENPEFEGFALWPVGLASARMALSEGTDEGFDSSLALLGEMTKRFTSEFAVRPLLIHDLDRALDRMAAWTTDSDWRVRRLASEGTRPLLPWAERIPALVADPAPTRPILDALHDDADENVRRSVANHLNDHSRAHPAFAVEVVRGWSGGEHFERVAHHALRTLVKRGDAAALELLGFPPVSLAVSPLEVSPLRVATGGAIAFGAAVENVGADPAPLVIDYVLSFPGARGDERSKVFKIMRRTLGPGERFEVRASHSFRPITTRRYYPGRYGVSLQINGVPHPRTDFELR
ncbi:DNA alkylation repair protein [Leucobacter tenebrionis]|uniref:DNA alkylation repair protein n=1 Tax=Leucobacter tenebrionis TaxID=2873270 RepID=UPI001CA67E2A|nr:DNA alkylation repair protein [Leucobacter tenebrionis]QZY52341.1 DNA alkylation repair protein [Leucobacter tenebrionis]